MLSTATVAWGFRPSASERAALNTVGFCQEWLWLLLVIVAVTRVAKFLCRQLEHIINEGVLHVVGEAWWAEDPLQRRRRRDRNRLWLISHSRALSVEINGLLHHGLCCLRPE